MKILTTKFNTKYDTALFENKNEDSCFIEGIALAKAEIDFIVETKRHPISQNTIEALDFSGYTPGF
jgi:hypothetical protein